MKRQKVLFLKENYVLRVLKSFMVAGLFVIALLLILVHKIDLGLISGVSKGVFFISAPLIHTAVLPAEAENAILKKLLHHIDVPNTRSYTARVIAENGNAFANSLIIYLGNAYPYIKSGYAVVNAAGLIGRIDIVSGRYARVTLITDINSKIPVVSQKSRDRGILAGNNGRELSLIFTPLLAELHKADLLVTSGIGGGLPPDIPVARIKRAGVDNITAVPLFTPSDIEVVKIIAYDVLPDPETAKELE